MIEPKNRKPFPASRPQCASRLSGRPAYRRESDLPRILGLWPGELRDHSAEGTAKIVTLLRKALRIERRRGRAGHWTYDLTRHLALSDALKHEEASLQILRKQEEASASMKPMSGSWQQETRGQ